MILLDERYIANMKKMTIKVRYTTKPKTDKNKPYHVSNNDKPGCVKKSILTNFVAKKG